MEGTTDMTSEREPLKPIPAADIAIEEGFAALDARIAEFASAIAQAVAEIGEAASRAADQPEAPVLAEVPQPSLAGVNETSPAEAISDGADQAGTVIPESSSGIADVEPDPAIEEESPEPVDPVGEAEIEPPSIEAEPEQAVDEAPQESALPEPEGEVARDVLGRVISPTPEPAEAETSPADTYSAQEQHDEKLLASLDEETANAIRIKRRLGLVKKPVSVLLAEYRASQAAQESAPKAKAKKKSWWTR
jgi:hypothetical protein